jgi:hypothetical protein
MEKGDSGISPKQMKPVTVDGNERSAIYPGNDPRVLRVLHKVVRGFSSFHDLESAVPEARVWADVLKYRLPEGLMTNLLSEHRLPDIFSYQYRRVDEPGLDSLWLLTFFEKRTFIAVVRSA